MESLSRHTTDTEDSVTKNFFEEVVVDTGVHPFDAKDDVVEVLLDHSVAKNIKSSIVPSDDSGDDDEDEDDDDDDEDDDEDDDDVDDDEEDSSSSSTTEIKSASGDEKEGTSNEAAKSKYTEQVLKSVVDSKSSNLKLVLKKTPELNLSNQPLVQAKTSTNQILLVTLVSNTATGPIYSTAKCSVAGGAINAIEKKCKDSIDVDKLDTKMNLTSSQINKFVSNKQNEINEETLNNKNIEKPKIEIVNGAETLQPENESKTSSKGKKELQQLQKTVIESKILSEFMSDNTVTKIRKSRKTLPLKYDNSSDIDNSDFIAKQRGRSRSCSKPRIASPIDDINLGKWPSEEKINKRQNMRSQNTEFVQKHMKFLNRVQADGEATDNSDGETSINDNKSIISVENNQAFVPRNFLPPPKPGWDSFCWKCHSGGEMIPCSKCVRSFHLKCLKSHVPIKIPENWICPECNAVDNRNKGISKPGMLHFAVDHLSQLLQFAFKRMSQLKGSDFFLHSLKEEDHPEYFRYIVNPVTLESVQIKIESQAYRCTEELAVEVKWILHNFIVYFGTSSKLFNVAKSIVKVCRQEVNEIETCAECYYNANTRKDWFVEVCSRPHILLWAKLKGFPYWPAKAMGINAAAAVDVRFFGDHDRAYVPIKECFLYSEKDPNPPTKQNKRNNIAECIKEVEVHIKKIKERFGKFVYADFRTPYDPGKDMEQLEVMVPGISEYIKNSMKINKPALTYKIVKTADNNLSIIKKQDMNGDTEKNCLKSVKEKEKSEESPLKNDSITSNKEVILTKSALESPINDKNMNDHRISSVKEINMDEKAVKSKHLMVISPKTYEVVSKKEENEVAKVNSVILKRKCDNWNAMPPSTNKKLKTGSPLDAQSVENVNTPSASKNENDKLSTEKNESPKESIKVKRKHSTDENVNRVQKIKISNNEIPPLVLLTQPYVTTTTAITITTNSVTFLTPSTTITCVPITSRINSVEVVTTKPTTTPQATTTCENPSNDSNSLNEEAKLPPNTEKAKDKCTTEIQETVKNPVSTDSDVANDNENLNDNHTETGANKETELQSSKTVESQTSSSVDKESIETNTVVGEDSSKNRPLIPFDEIKIENVETNPNEIQSQRSESVEIIRSKTATPEKPDDTSPTTPIDPNHSQQKSQIEETESPVIKTENFSDDESSNLCKAAEIDKQDNVDKNIADISANRISVKDISKLRSQSTTTRKSDTNDNNKSEGGKVENKKQTQRARKTFPNKATFNPALGMPPAKRSNFQPINFPNNKNFNSMVYIPVDNTKAVTPVQTNIPIPPLAAVSKAQPTQSLNPISITTNAPSSNISSTNTVGTTSTTTPATSTAPLQTSLPISTSSQSNLLPNNNPPSSPQHMLSGFVTPNLAAAITDTIVRGPPKLAPRPTGPMRSDGDYVFPSEAGPVCKTLMNNAHKMTDFFRSVIEDTLSDMANNGVLEAKIKMLEIELEKVKHLHAQELSELKNNTDLMLCEMRSSMENEKTRLVAETRKQCEIERIRSIEEAKKKQWCANCGKEAQFYCCWNTSYCDYPCQQKHWGRHMNNCAQNDNSEINAQKMGAKIATFNVKDKQQSSKTKDIPVPRIANTFLRAAMPVPRNPLPVQRLVPISSSSNPRYTILNRDGNWELMSSPPNFQHKILPSAGLIMTEPNAKNLQQMPPSLMVESLIRNSHL